MIFERLFRPKTTRIELDLTDAQIVQLRTVMDGLPLNRYVTLVLAVLPKLPLAPSVHDYNCQCYDCSYYKHPQCRPESDAVPSNNGADADRQAHSLPRGPVGGFSLRAVTPNGKAGVQEIDRQLARLPHTGDL